MKQEFHLINKSGFVDANIIFEIFESQLLPKGMRMSYEDQWYLIVDQFCLAQKNRELIYIQHIRKLA